MRDACTTLQGLAREPAWHDRLVFQATIPARAGRAGAVPAELHPDTVARLHSRGLDSLWSHQASALDHLLAGRHTVIATGTASGKSLCYQLPVIDGVVRGGADTALLVFPTKALAQDQLRAMRSWLVPGLKAVTYDGDTPPDDRAWARRHANVVLTNPEMLHQAILPFHRRWATFLMRLRFVIVDELHMLRGIFGSHVAHVLRRLRRVCEHYRAAPTFCFASATIGNPAELASTLCGDRVVAVDDDGSPRSERCLGLWQRPVVDEHTGRRAPSTGETAELLARFVRGGHPSLVFTRSRRGAELVASRARDALAATDAALVARVAAYRAGYLPEERRTLERQLSDGTLLGVAATSALELGIDVGGLDAVILQGFPGTLASLRQQAGRAGRSGRRAAAVLVAGDDQLDQWYVHHPDELLTRPAEAAVVNPSNPFVLRPHVACAAHELPLDSSDERWFGPGLDDAVRELVLEDLVKPRGGRMYWAGRDAPAPSVGLRSGSSVEFELVGRDAGEDRVIGTVDAARVFSVAHPGALYLHQGRQWRVADLLLEQLQATLDPADDVDEITTPREETDIAVVTLEDSSPCGEGRGSIGSVDVTTRVVAYQRRRASTGQSIDVVPLDLPARTLRTRACWYTIAAERTAAAGIAPTQVLGAVHAAEHALIGLLPLFAICDRWDVGGVSMAWNPDTGEPTIFIYDGYPGGAGIAELAFADIDAHVHATLELVRACPCPEGCPSCVQSPKCGNWNEMLDKQAAIALLELLAVR